MDSPVPLDTKPMLAKLSREIPVAAPGGAGLLYEPKWDGFRCIVFRDGDEIVLSSRNQKPFNRYFPELLPVLAEALPAQCVVDGEIVIPDAGDPPGQKGLDFDALQQRIHPAESRVRRLAAETPAAFVAFDLLGFDRHDLRGVPFGERRALLQRAVTPVPPGDHGPGVYLTPSTTDPAVAAEWFTRFEGAGLDGVMAKPLDGTYTPDQRTLWKVKHARTADCAVAGFRLHKDGEGVGSLLLGLYGPPSGFARPAEPDLAAPTEFGDSLRSPAHPPEPRDVLHHVGVCAAFTAQFRRELVAELEPLTHDALDGHPWGEWAEAQARYAEEHAGQRMPGNVSRWNAGKDLSFVPLRVERVVEVTFGQLENGRFRHGVGFVRWRPDRTPESCRYDQLDVANPVPFRDLFA